MNFRSYVLLAINITFYFATAFSLEAMPCMCAAGDGNEVFAVFLYLSLHPILYDCV